MHIHVIRPIEANHDHFLFLLCAPSPFVMFFCCFLHFVLHFRQICALAFWIYTCISLVNNAASHLGLEYYFLENIALKRSTYKGIWRKI